MKVNPAVVAKTKLKTFEDVERVKALKDFITHYGHKCENTDRGALSKLAKKVQTRRKNHCKNNDHLGRALRKEPYTTSASLKGDAGSIPEFKKPLYVPVQKNGQEAVQTELNNFLAKEKRMAMIIGIINRKKRAGTYECIHDASHTWTSMTMAPDKSHHKCNCCGMRIEING